MGIEWSDVCKILSARQVLVLHVSIMALTVCMSIQQAARGDFTYARATGFRRVFHRHHPQGC